VSWHKIRYFVAAFAFVALFGGNLMQQWYYVGNRLDEFDSIMHSRNIIIGWILLACAVAFSLKSETEDQTE
jgi:hypothetical protein